MPWLELESRSAYSLLASSSAVARPRMTFADGESQDVLDLAVSLLFGIARNHPFQQGNKRTGFIATIVFLELNGFELGSEDTDLLAELVTQVLRGFLTESQVAEILRPYLVETAA